MEDDEIIRLFYSRCEQAVTEVAKKYGDILSFMSYNILKNKMDVEECVNDAYLAAWNTIPPQMPNSLSAYLLGIVRNISIKKYHKNSAAKRNSYYDVALSELKDCFADVESVEERCEEKELADLISLFLDGLDRKSRLLFVRRYYFSDSTKKLADMFSISENNVSVRLHRIRNKLKKYLKKEGYGI